MPKTSCSALAKARTVVPVTVRSKRFLEETDTLQSSKILKLDDVVTTTEGHNMIKAGRSGRKEATEAESSDSSCDAGAVSLGTGTVISLLERLDFGSIGSGSDVGDVLKPVFLARSQTVGQRNLLAALLLFAPHITANGSGMPRCWRCLKGGRKMSPSTSKQPRTYATLCASVCRLVKKKNSEEWQSR